MKIQNIIAQKVISDPIRGIIDIRPVLPLIEHNYHFQSLNYKYQLGLSYLIFPMATHTRRAHSFGSYEATVQSAKRLRGLGMLNRDEAKALCAFALLHDIGHFPFSHVTEALVPFSHDEYGVKIIESMKEKIEKMGIDFRLFKSIFEHKNPLYLIVHDKNLGTEKLDYLERDGFYTILSRPPGIEYLQRHIYFIKNDLAIDEKAVDNARDIQDFYIKMYKMVYFRKASIIGQRMMQKMVYRLITSKELSVKKLITLNDFQLLGHLGQSKDKVAKYLYKLLMERRLFKEAMVIRYNKFTFAENVAGKSIKVLGVDSKTMKKIIKSPKLMQKSPKSLQKLEEAIAKLLRIKSQDVLVVPIMNPERFKTKDIKILTSGYKISSLKREHPAHFLDMKETARAYAALRVCTQEQYREKMAQKGEEIKDLIIDFL